MVNMIELALGVNKIAEGVMWLIGEMFKGIGNYGVAVICFTLILKLIMSPLDIWQKAIMTKNNRAMERMRPQLEKLQKQYAGNKELFSQKQMELYRKEKYSMMGSCLPMIISMVIFFLVFSGFNGMIKEYNEEMFMSMQTVYEEAYDKSIEAENDIDAATKNAEQAVLDNYDNNYKKQIRFLWVKNVFMPDSWKRPIPDYETFRGSGIGKLGINNMEFEFSQTGYDKVMGVLMRKYNDYNQDGKQKAWNGTMLLPIIAALLTLASTKLMQQAQPPVPTAGDGQGGDMQSAMQTNMKFMQYFTPIMLGVLALLYSTAFTIYMLISNIFSTVFQLIYNLVVKYNDKKREEKRLETTYK